MFRVWENKKDPTIAATTMLKPNKHLEFRRGSKRRPVSFCKALFPKPV